MKRSHFKIILACLVALMLLGSVFTIISFAGGSYAEITLVENSSSYKKSVLKGNEFVIPEPDPDDSVGGIVYGWFDKAGNLYEPGEKINPKENITLYRAEGDEFALSPSLALYCQKGYSYVKLNSSITIDSPIELPKDKILYIDLNGNTINATTPIKYDTNGEETASGLFYGNDCGVIFANSSTEKANIKYTADGDKDFLFSSLVSLSPSPSAKNLIVLVKENISIATNMNLVSIETDISEAPGLLSLSIYGSVDAARLLRSNGISDAYVRIYDGAKVDCSRRNSSSESTDFRKTSSDFMFEDVISGNNRVVVLEIYGGDVLLNVGFIKNTIRLNPFIYGGRFSSDISSLFQNNNFVFEYDETSKLYLFKGCNHVGPLVENVDNCAADCEENHIHKTCLSPRTLKHRCIYCNEEFLQEYPDGVGHSLRMELVQAPVNTPEETKPALYRTYCTRGDVERFEYAYPDPASVYVTVKYTEKDQKTGAVTDIKTIRIPSKDMFDFDESNKTKIMSYSADNVYTYDEEGNKIYISPESIIFVEVPLGTTDLYGELKSPDKTPTPVGVFTNDYYLQEVSLPSSLVNVGSYAFFNMQSIEKFTGLENITGSIGTAAFLQPTNTKLAFDYFDLNAKSVGYAAFGNIIIKNVLTISDNVDMIVSYAFGLGLKFNYDNGQIEEDPDYKDNRTDAEITKEIFIENYIGNVGVTLNKAKGNTGSYHQFSDLPIVFTDHDYIKNSVAPTCISYGYDLYRCSRCFIEYEDNHGTTYGDHDYVDHRVEPTCQAVGFIGKRCLVCDDKPKDKDIPINKDNHTYAAGVVKYAIGEDKYFCVDPYYTLRLCGCGKIEAFSESTVSFTFPGDTSETKWNFYILSNGDVIVFENGKMLSNSSYSMTIEDGIIKELVCNNVAFVITKLTGSEDTSDTLSGTYEATHGSTFKFPVTVVKGTAINAVVPSANATHNFKDSFVIEPTCVEGRISSVCVDCKYKPADRIAPPVLEHTREKIVYNEATCSTPESGVYKCTACGGETPYEFTGKFDTTKHAKRAGDPGVVIAEPSTEHTGRRRFQCKDCGGDIFEDIPVIDNSLSFTIPILNITINTDKRTFRIALIIIFVSIPLLAGILLTFVFTFTRKKSKSAGYKFRFNTIKKGEGGSNKSVAEQLAEMNLVDELPPDVELNENGERNDEAAWTAYVDALNNDYTRTIELNLQKEIEEDSSVDEVKPDTSAAWAAYVEAINKNYEETMELTLKEEAEEKSLSDLMADTIVDMSLSSFTNPDEVGEGEETFDLGEDSEGEETFDLGEPSDDETFSL